MERPAPDLPDSLGPFAVRSVLGTGGFATVYLCWDEALESLVAVKVLAHNWARQGDVRDRFVAEARLLRRADDERVVRVHAIAELDDGRPYVVMEYADGGSLADRIDARRRRPWPAAEALGVLVELCGCVEVIHGLGVIHRDLKPDNLLYRRVPPHRRRPGGPEETMVLADLGLARSLAEASRFTVTVGTPGYMAPELAVPFAALDERVDVYSAGAVVHELLFGRPPGPDALLGAEGEPPGDRRRLATELWLAGEELADEERTALVDLLVRALAADPAQRIPTMAALRAEAQAWLDAGPADPRRRARSRGRRDVLVLGEPPEAVGPLAAELDGSGALVTLLSLARAPIEAVVGAMAQRDAVVVLVLPGDVAAGLALLDRLERAREAGGSRNRTDAELVLVAGSAGVRAAYAGERRLRGCTMVPVDARDPAAAAWAVAAWLSGHED